MQKGRYGVTTLYNSIKVVTEKIDTIDAVNVGIYVEVGSRHEADDERGISHVIEHMMFKGTKTRSSIDIFRTFENIGADVNAYTDRDCTCYHSTTPTEHLPLVMEVFADMLMNHTFDKEELAKELNVILEECYMREDRPDIKVIEYAIDNVYNGNPVGKSIIGVPETIKSFTRDKLIEYFNKYYTGCNMIVSMAGNIDHDYAVKLVTEYLINIPQGTSNTFKVLDGYGQQIKMLHINDDLAQSQIVITIGGLTMDDVYERGDLINILVKYIGGGMSSRLPRLIREKHGLAYSVSAFGESFVDGGIIAIYIGTQHENVETVINMAKSELLEIREDGIDEADFETALNIYKGQLILHYETISSRCSRNANLLMARKELVPLEEKIEKVSKYTVDDLYEFACTLLHENNINIDIIGPTNVAPEGFKLMV